MGPIKNPLRRGETERKGGWRKKEREAQGIDVRNEQKGGGGGRQRGKEDEEGGRASRARRVARPFSLFFKTWDTLSSVVDQRSTCSVPRINSGSNLERELCTFQREK